MVNLHQCNEVYEPEQQTHEKLISMFHIMYFLIPCHYLVQTI